MGARHTPGGFWDGLVKKLKDREPAAAELDMADRQEHVALVVAELARLEHLVRRRQRILQDDEIRASLRRLDDLRRPSEKS